MNELESSNIYFFLYSAIIRGERKVVVAESHEEAFIRFAEQFGEMPETITYEKRVDP